ncbi:MAG: TolC family protein, partial [Rubrivivax sp.]
DVLAEVTRRFITVATQQEQLQLARKAAQLAQQTVNGAQRRVDAAKSPHAELDRARIALDRARLDQRRAEAELDSARLQLAATWGESKPVIKGLPMGEVQADLFSLPAPDDFDVLATRLDVLPLAEN